MIFKKTTYTEGYLGFLVISFTITTVVRASCPRRRDACTTFPITIPGEPIEQGFSLVEVLASIVILIIILGVTTPLFLNQRLENFQSEIRTGAVAVSQQILDDFRQKDPATLPNSGHETQSVSVMGHQYNAKIYYCENASLCSPGGRQIRVEVSHNGQTVYNVETFYTRFR